MIRRPPRSTRTDTRFPYPTLFRSRLPPAGISAVRGGDGRIEFGIGQGRESLERLAGCGVHGLIDHGLHLNLAVAVARGDGPSAPAPRETTSSDQSCVRPDALFSAIQRFSSSVPSRGGKDRKSTRLNSSHYCA